MSESSKTKSKTSRKISPYLTVYIVTGMILLALAVIFLFVFGRPQQQDVSVSTNYNCPSRQTYWAGSCKDSKIYKLEIQMPDIVPTVWYSGNYFYFITSGADAKFSVHRGTLTPDTMRVTYVKLGEVDRPSNVRHPRIVGQQGNDLIIEHSRKVSKFNISTRASSDMGSCVPSSAGSDVYPVASQYSDGYVYCLIPRITQNSQGRDRMAVQLTKLSLTGQLTQVNQPGSMLGDRMYDIRNDFMVVRDGNVSFTMIGYDSSFYDNTIYAVIEVDQTGSHRKVIPDRSYPSYQPRLPVSLTWMGDRYYLNFTPHGQLIPNRSQMFNRFWSGLGDSELSNYFTWGYFSDLLRIYYAPTIPAILIRRPNGSYVYSGHQFTSLSSTIYNQITPKSINVHSGQGGPSIDPIIGVYTTKRDRSSLLIHYLRFEEPTPEPTPEPQPQPEPGEGVEQGGYQVTPGAAGSPIATTEHNGQIFQSVRGRGSNRIYLRSTADGVFDGSHQRENWQLLEGQTLDEASIVSFKGKIYLTVIGSTGRIFTKTSNLEATSWSGWVEQTGLAGAPVTSAVFKDKMFQFTKAPGNSEAMYVRSTSTGEFNGTEASHQWKVIDGQTPSTIAVATYDDRLYMSVRGRTGRIFIRYTTDGEVWQPWKEMGGTTDVPPAIGGVEDHKLFQVVKGNGSSRLFVRYTIDGEDWTRWFEIDGPSVLRPSVTQFEDKGLITIVDTSGRIKMQTIN